MLCLKMILRPIGNYFVQFSISKFGDAYQYKSFVCIAGILLSGPQSDCEVTYLPLPLHGLFQATPPFRHPRAFARRWG